MEEEVEDVVDAGLPAEERLRAVAERHCGTQADDKWAEVVLEDPDIKFKVCLCPGLSVSERCERLHLGLPTVRFSNSPISHTPTHHRTLNLGRCLWTWRRASSRSSRGGFRTTTSRRCAQWAMFCSSCSRRPHGNGSCSPASTLVAFRRTSTSSDDPKLSDNQSV